MSYYFTFHTVKGSPQLIHLLTFVLNDQYVLFLGIGIFSSVGGSSSGTSGGGSAGRIAIHSSNIIKYQGRYQVFGGEASSDTNAGGGGTVYLQDIR